MSTTGTTTVGTVRYEIVHGQATITTSMTTNTATPASRSRRPIQLRTDLLGDDVDPLVGLVESAHYLRRFEVFMNRLGVKP